MMHTNFTSNGVRYQLVTVGISHREKEALADNIKPEGLTRTQIKNLGGLTDPKVRKAPDRRHYAK